MARSDSLTNPSTIRALADRKARDKSRLFFVEGERFVIAALTTRTIVEQVVIVRGRRLLPPLSKLIAQHRRVLELERDEFESLSRSREPTSSSGVGAVVRMPWTTLPERPKRGPWLCFEAVRSYGNLGSALRSAVAFEAGGVAILGDELDPFDPAVVRATMGAIFHLPIVRTTPTALRRWCRQQRAQIIGTSAKGRRDLRSLRLQPPSVLMIGHERGGMSELQRELCDDVVRIPISARVDSLNLATATSVLLYESWWRETD
jgi:TrmH family RNA methyltransferase